MILILLVAFFFNFCSTEKVTQSDAIRIITQGKCNETNDFELCQKCDKYVRCDALNQSVLELKENSLNYLCTEIGSLIYLESLQIIGRPLSVRN